MAKTHQPRLSGLMDVPSSGAYIPEKLYFRIGEVSRLTGTKPYVLRYWETEFPTLKPVKSRSGHRLYRRDDVQSVFEIRRLLYAEGFTIEGARKKLAGNSSNGPKDSANVSAKEQARGDGSELRAVQSELQAILTMLSRKC